MAVHGMDYDGVMRLTIRRDLEAYLAKTNMKYDDFARVIHWRPANNTPDDCELTYIDKDVHLVYDALYPVLEGVNVKWGYSPELLGKAFGVFEAFEKEPKFLCCKSKFPLIVEVDKPVDMQKENDIVVLIAPTLQAGGD